MLYNIIYLSIKLIDMFNNFFFVSHIFKTKAVIEIAGSSPQELSHSPYSRILHNNSKDKKQNK